MAFIDSTMTTVCVYVCVYVRARESTDNERGMRIAAAFKQHIQLNWRKWQQRVIWIYSQRFIVIVLCFSVLEHRSPIRNLWCSALVQFMVLGRVCVCVCLIFILFVWREQERDSMAILCDLWGESEENWTKHKSWLHSISFHNILTPSLCVILMFHVIFLLFVLRLLLSNRIIFLSDCAYVSAKVLQLNKLLPYF